MKRELIHALVLHRRPYRETSLIVDFFSKEYGKVSAICKGVRGGKSSRQSERKSLLQPFQALSIELTGRHELKTLVGVESVRSAFTLAGNGLFSGFYLNELLNRLLPKEVALPEVFDLYVASLLRLAQAEPLEPVLREFELNLLAQLGYGINWLYDAQSGGAIDHSKHYTFVNELGFIADPLENRTQNHFIGQALLDAGANCWNPRSLACAKRVMRMALAPVLGDKPLKSRELFLSMEKNE